MTIEDHRMAQRGEEFHMTTSVAILKSHGGLARGGGCFCVSVSKTVNESLWSKVTLISHFKS